ncbi:aromatic acid exporter family protein [Gracilibacillus oryzae]|uniref:Aromatic acid exporter family protein n=1 Tax=Gracilibacillus oryzae TaxID=1672701 RepID=A0A7C8GQ33_9BACI|nr:aromatic acid exporter family protein [Gracilibacillus oryzae]KAB8125853.1 aromatic acid exporter family protein [Gracilibacillus oryzae]
MIKKLSIKIFGRRVMKTALAVFLTSLICEWIGWPAVFAVITAIVTIEPTVASSIKKGIVRLPASAIGSFYAVVFIYFFGNSPITYTLAALFTIITCYRLGLNAGLLVATLTSVAMIEVIHANLLISFVIRLGTTTVGLLVSTLVNMFVLPPNYTKKISMNYDDLLKQTAEAIGMITKMLIQNDQNVLHKKEAAQRFQKIKVALDKTDELLQYQADEAKYHRLQEDAKQLFKLEQVNAAKLRLVHYHIGNLINTPVKTVCWSKDECEEIMLMVDTLVDFMKYPDHYKAKAYKQQVKKLMEHFWHHNKPQNEEQENVFTSEVIILYELLSIYNLTEDIIKNSKAISN